MAIRCSAKAIVLHDGKMLLNRNDDEYNGVHFTLPGGGQNQYEPMQEALVRECLEETGYLVEPVRFAALYEQIWDDPAARAANPDYAHQIFHIFICRLANAVQSAPTELDGSQISSGWVALDSLPERNILPRLARERLGEILGGAAPMFLGTERIP